MAEPFWQRHDLSVVGVAALVLGAAWLLCEPSPDAAMKPVTRAGLTAWVPAGWIADPGSGDANAATVARGEDALTRIELRVLDRPPGQVTVDASLELERGHRYGQLYQRTDSARRTVDGREWLRTTYAYAFKPTPTHAPRLASAVEYAWPAESSVDAPHLFVVTLTGPEERVKELEPKVFSRIGVAP
jgi:hypothetical protein